MVPLTFFEMSANLSCSVETKNKAPTKVSAFLIEIRQLPYLAGLKPNYIVSGKVRASLPSGTATARTMRSAHLRRQNNGYPLF